MNSFFFKGISINFFFEENLKSKYFNNFSCSSNSKGVAIFSFQYTFLLHKEANKPVYFSALLTQSIYSMSVDLK